MAIRFQNLALDNKDLFGVSLEGTVSRSDKGALQELADQAMKRGKVHLVLDMSGLTSLGGAGAGVLAGFQKRLLDKGGEAVFAGVKPIVRHFLNSKFGDLPHRHFPSAEVARDNFHNASYEEPPFELADEEEPAPRAAATLDTESAPVPAPEVARNVDANEDELETGAMSFHDESEESDSNLDGLLAEFTGKEARKGRRKEYRYTSLDEAVAAVGSWHAGRDREEFGSALTNLLFSQGLADAVTMMFPTGIELQSLDGQWHLPLAGSFASQLVAGGRPLSMLDIRDDELNQAELDFLEEVNPEMILPLLVGNQLVGAVLLANDDAGREYSVGESFAFELLLKVLNRQAEEPAAASARVADAEPYKVSPAPSDDLVEAARSLDTGSLSAGAEMDNVLFQLAMDLPEADDRPHFWRIFQRHVSRTHPIARLGFLDPGSHRPQVMFGPDNDWMALDLGHERLQMFFRTMERPVMVDNLPSFFKDVKEKMQATGVHWLVPMRHEDTHLGLVLLACDLDRAEGAPEDRLMRVFEPTARLLARFDGRQDDADVTRDLVQVLMGEREKRCYGSDNITLAMAGHLDMLAREMAMPLDQHRDLVHGCLLRDLGLVGQGDDLMTSPDTMTPEQLQVYYQHPQRGEELVAGLGLPTTIVEVIAAHHERFNGQGYPEGLAGREIPLAARIVTVVENYVGMVQGVGGRDPLTPAEAAEEMQKDPGGRFDPDILAVFLKAVLPNQNTTAPEAEAQEEMLV